MTRLRQRDLAAFSQALSILYAEVSAATLSDRILATLRALFDCDFASFSLMDLRRGQFHHSVLAPLVPDWPGTETHQRHLPSDPAATHIMRTREPFAVRISDFISLREYRNLSVYTEVFGRVGCDRRLGFAVQDVTAASLVATLNRRRKDFTDEERALLDLLRPHLLQSNVHAYADRLLQAERTRGTRATGRPVRRGAGRDRRHAPAALAHAARGNPARGVFPRFGAPTGVRPAAWRAGAAACSHVAPAPGAASGRTPPPPAARLAVCGT